MEILNRILKKILNQIKQRKKYLYDSQTIKVIQTPGWTENKDKASNNKGNVLFQNGKLKAVVTVVSNEKSLEEIKNELKKSFRSIEEIEESDHYVSFKTNRKKKVSEPIFTSILVMKRLAF